MLALADRQRDPAVLALRRQRLDFGRLRDRPVVELDALAQDLHLIERDRAVDLRVIGLRDVARRCEQLRRELAIVREQQHALGVVIEATDRLHRHRHVRQVIHHRRAPAIIGHRRDAAFRLVEQHVELLECDDRLAIDQHVIVVWIDLRAEHRDYLAIHGHTAGRDQGLGLAPRGHTGGCQEALETDSFAHGRTCISSPPNLRISDVLTRRNRHLSSSLGRV